MCIRAMGMAWYREEDWPEIKRIMSDAYKLHATYAEWFKSATAGEQHLKQQGIIVERVYIDPREFPAWCRARGLNADAAARMRFGNEFVFQKYQHTN